MLTHSPRLPFFGFLLLGLPLLGQARAQQVPFVPVAVAQPASPAAAALVVVKDDSLPFSVGLPQDWQSLNLPGGMGGVSIASQKTAPYSMIRMLYLPKQGRSVDLHSEFDHFEAALRGAGVKVTKQSESPLKCGGLSGLLRQYSLSSAAGSMTMQVWFGLGARNFYSFQLTSPPSRFASDKATFARVLGSVNF